MPFTVSPQGPVRVHEVSEESQRMRHRCFAVVAGLLALLWVLPLRAQDARPVIQPNENLVVEGIPAIPSTIADEVRLYTEGRSAGFLGWHPVRREMLISTRFGDASQVHLVKAPLGARKQLTFSPEGVRGARFHPRTGDSILLLQDTGGNENYQALLLDPSTGRSALLTDGKSRHTGFAWSNDGSKLIYGTNKRNGKDTDLYLLELANPKSPRELMQLEGGGWSTLAWSPDDRYLILSEYVSVVESHLWLVDVAAGSKRRLTKHKPGDKVSYGGARFTPDGKAFYTTTDRDSEFERLVLFDIATGNEKIVVGDMKHDIDGFSLSRNGSLLAFVTNEDGIGRLHLLETQTGKLRAVPALPNGVISGLSWHRNGRDLAFGISSSRSPGDVYVFDVVANRVERWTESETGGLVTDKLPEATVVRWPSFDGKIITGLLYMPPPDRFKGPRPVIVNVHGGPEGQSRPWYLGATNYYLMELGVAVLYPNVRGSTGFGKTFVALDDGFKREDSYRDLETLLDWIKTQPTLDGSRILVTGGSYGGHMAFVAATRFPEKLAAVVSVVGMSNLVSFLERTESYRRDLRRVEYGDERDPKMREFLLRIAPLNNLEKATKPLFVIAGFNDPRVPVSEPEQMVKALQARKVPVWYLMAKDEGHGFAKKRNRDFQFYATIAFIREHLLK